MSVSYVEDKLAKLPALPEGWYYEDHSFDPWVVHIVWPNRGAFSIHFKRRTIASGWTIPSPARSAKLVGGRGWKDDLVQEAVNGLKSAWGFK